MTRTKESVIREIAEIPDIFLTYENDMFCGIACVFCEDIQDVAMDDYVHSSGCLWAWCREQVAQENFDGSVEEKHPEMKSAYDDERTGEHDLRPR